MMTSVARSVQLIKQALVVSKHRQRVFMGKGKLLTSIYRFLLLAGTVERVCERRHSSEPKPTHTLSPRAFNLSMLVLFFTIYSKIQL